jgi:predicted negative regulator of RcsB-dependent stress response
VDTYNQQDELDKLKEWWKNYGNALIVGVLIGVALLFGSKYWRQQQERQRQNASALYEDVQQAFRDKHADKARAGGAQLARDFASTPYAGMAALLLARHYLESGDRAHARQQLEWAIANAVHAPSRHAARLRLARLLADGGDSAGALALTEIKDKSGFEAEYLELRGDLLAALGRRNEARAAYREAIKGAREATAYNAVLRLKLEDLGPDETP